MHDLTDPIAGFPELTGLEFLGVDARIHRSRSPVIIDEITAVALTSLKPINGFFPGVAKRVFVGGQRVSDSTCDDCFVARGTAGPGVSLVSAENQFAFFIFGEVDARAGRSISGPRALPVTIGPVMTAGLRARFHHRLLALVEGSSGWYPRSNGAVRVHRTHGNIRWGLGRSVAFNLHADLDLNSKRHREGVDLMVYF